MVNQGCASGISRGCRIKQGLRVLGLVPKLFPDTPGFHRICLSPSLSLSLSLSLSIYIYICMYILTYLSLNLLILVHIYVQIWGFLVYSWYMCIYIYIYIQISIVWGLGFRVEGLGFKGFGIQDLGSGLGFWAPSMGSCFFLGGIYGLGPVHPRITIKGPYQGP